jgi:peroxiredoxin
MSRPTVIVLLTCLFLITLLITLVPVKRPMSSPGSEHISGNESRQPKSAGPRRLDATPVGRTIADFTLRDFRGKEHALHELSGKKAVVVVFLGSACPLAKLYGPRLAELVREFTPHGAAFLGINANAQDSLADVAAYARLHKIPCPILLDPDHAVADQMGAMRTPEAFVLDERHVVRYWGRIDDQYAIGVQRSRPGRRDLADALRDVLAGRPVARPVVPSAGCHIGRLPRTRLRGAVTYTGQVRRILHRRCVGCHRPREIAPFPLTTYKNVKAWSAMIREVVQEGRMPPWFASPRHGRFRNDARLTPAEKRLLLQWIDNGCPRGDPAEPPPPASFPTGWRIPRPDRVLYMADKPFTVPAEGEVMYQYWTVDPGFTETRYLQAVEVRPGNRAVVHHALVSIVPPSVKEMGLGTTGALLDYAPGMPPTILPPGQALRVPAGAKFLFQMHYTPNGSVQQDRSYLGMVFADPKTVKHCVQGGAVINPAIDIPSGAADYHLTAEYRVESDIRLLSLSPHMHLRGKSFRFEAVFPDGRREILLDVPRYDFNWQLRYDLQTPRDLPRGTRLLCTAHYDNSRENPANPDPSQNVGWGDQTRDEMLIGFFSFTTKE